MTMPHSKRPRRNKLNKIRKRQGLPPLPVLVGPEPKDPRSAPVTTMMIPLPVAIRKMLTRVRRETQRRDPSTAASDQLFAGAVLTAMLPQIHAQLFPPSQAIVPPTQANLEQAKKVGQVLAQGFHG